MPRSRASARRSISAPAPSAVRVGDFIDLLLETKVLLCSFFSLSQHSSWVKMKEEKSEARSGLKIIVASFFCCRLTHGLAIGWNSFHYTIKDEPHTHASDKKADNARGRVYPLGADAAE